MPENTVRAEEVAKPKPIDEVVESIQLEDIKTEREILLEYVVDNADLKPMTRAEVRKFAKENEMPKGMKLESDRDVLKTLAHWVTRGKESEVDAGLAIQTGKNQPWHEEIDGKTRKVKSINVYEANGETPAQIAVFYEGVEKVMEGDKEVEKPTMGILYYQQGSKEVFRTQFTREEVDEKIKKREEVEETPKQKTRPEKTEEKPKATAPKEKGLEAAREAAERILKDTLKKVGSQTEDEFNRMVEDSSDAGQPKEKAPEPVERTAEADTKTVERVKATTEKGKTKTSAPKEEKNKVSEDDVGEALEEALLGETTDKTTKKAA